MAFRNVGPWLNPTAGGNIGGWRFGDIGHHLGIFWQCRSTGTQAVPGTDTTWAPVGNGQELGQVSYNVAAAGTVTATSAATAACFDTTNLAVLNSAFPTMRVPSSGRVRVELEGLAYMSGASLSGYFVPLSSTAAGSTFALGGGVAYARVIDGNVSDTLHLRRRASIVCDSLTPGAALSVYFGGFVSAGTLTLAGGSSSGLGPISMRVMASP